MKKLIILCFAIPALLYALVACNGTAIDTDYYEGSTVMQRFSLDENNRLLKNIDTVFFTIDLLHGEVFNADSLPYGTATNKLVAKIVMLHGASEATLTVTKANGTDTVIDYITNPEDSIDFSNGPVRFDVTSLDGSSKMTYNIKVNVHQVKSDSLIWGNTAMRDLPSAFEAPTAQRTVKTDAGVYCMTQSDGAYSISYATTPADDEWEAYTPALPENADMSTFSATTNALYILADGKLHESTDGGKTWTDTQESWTTILGGYGDRIIGTLLANDDYFIVDHPASDQDGTLLPEGMPIKGNSIPVEARFPMALNPQISITGGELPDGTLTNSTWAYDGTTWALISNIPIPKKLTGMAVVPFYTYITNDIFITTEYPVLLAFGGTDGVDYNKTVYLSNDYGMTWREGGESIQLPNGIPATYDAQAYVYDTMMTSRSASCWTTFDTHCRLAGSRATEPVTEWACPYIYTFGGIAYGTGLQNTIWRGSIYRMMFKPLI